MKAKLKKIFIFFNFLMGKFLPIIDHRKNTDISMSFIMSSETIIDKYDNYKIITEENPYWLFFFEKGIDFPSLFYITLSNCYIIGRGLVLNEKKKLFSNQLFFKESILISS